MSLLGLTAFIMPPTSTNVAFIVTVSSGGSSSQCDHIGANVASWVIFKLWRILGNILKWQEFFNSSNIKTFTKLKIVKKNYA